MTVDYPSGRQWTLQGDGQTAVVVEVGGGLRSYAAAGAEIVDGYAAGELPPGAAGQVLAPWPNRVRDGAYKVSDERYQLALNEPSRNNAIHGLVRWVSWTAVAESAQSVTLEHVLQPHPGYPWRLALRTTYTLDPDGLRVGHEAVNLAATAAPFGLGAHPYLRIPGVAVAELALCVPARVRLLLDGRLLPIGAAKVAGSEFDFAQPRRIGDAKLDVAFGGLERTSDGRCTVTLTAPDGRGVQVWADDAFPWWQIYTGDELPGERFRRSVAIEPMSCPPDGLRSGRDLAMLAPGETWRGEWGLCGVQ